MKRKMLTNEQIKELGKNKNVKDCGPGKITYSPKFKLRAVKMYREEGLSPNQIFISAGFDIEMIGKNKPKQCLRDWIKKYNRGGEAGLLGGGKKKKAGRLNVENMSDKEKIEYLEAKVAYLDAENDFLAKLRGLKRE
jgi:transposase